MKNPLLRLLSYPLVQVLSFCIILVGSPYFGGPYLFFVLGSFAEGYAFGIMGIIGIAIAVISLFIPARGYMQTSSVLVMLCSLAFFFFSSTWENATITLFNLPAILTLFLFIVVSIAVFIKALKWKNS